MFQNLGFHGLLAMKLIFATLQRGWQAYVRENLNSCRLKAPISEMTLRKNIKMQLKLYSNYEDPEHDFPEALQPANVYTNFSSES